jgi:hypothetical protein
MSVTSEPSSLARQARQALLLWSIFFVAAIVLNGTLPFILGVDLRPWTQSPAKSILFSFVVYAVLFLAAPLIIIKGQKTVRQPAFLVPLCIAMAALTFWQVLRGIAVVSVIVLAYLHWRFDLADYGIKSHGWKGDVLAILLMGVLGLAPVLLRSSPLSLSPARALLAGLDRLLANPASSVENLFYFGFLAERLSYRTGKWLTPLLIGLMYTAHEMTNPEYWYGGTSFVVIFVGVTFWAALYLWRRGAVAIWLGDGVYRFVGKLF